MAFLAARRASDEAEIANYFTFDGRAGVFYGTAGGGELDIALAGGAESALTAGLLGACDGLRRDRLTFDDASRRSDRGREGGRECGRLSLH